MSIIRCFSSWVAGNTDGCYSWKDKPVSHIKWARGLPLATKNIYWCFQSSDLCRKRASFFFFFAGTKLISSKTIFYKEVENIKQALINNGFPNYIVDEQIKRMIKNVNQQNKQCTTPSSQQTYIKHFYRNQLHYNYKSDEKVLKTLIHKNILPLILIKK